MSSKTAFIVFLAVLFACSPMAAQGDPETVTDQTLGGTGGRFETVELANGGVNLSLHLMGTKGRGINFDYNVNYTSKIWSQKPGFRWSYKNPWSVFASGDAPIEGGTGSTVIDQCLDQFNHFQNITAFTNTLMTYPDGSQKTFPTLFINVPSSCKPPLPVGADYAVTYSSDLSSHLLLGASSIAMPDGTTFGRDANGNTITKSIPAAGQVQYVDSTGRPVLQVQNTNNNPTTLTLADGSAIHLTWGTVTANTNFTGNPNVECVNCPVTVLTQVTLPNGKSWTFDYAPNSYAQLTKVHLPTGGYIRYTYGVQQNFYNDPAGGFQQALVVTGRFESADGVNESPGSSYSYAVTLQTQAPSQRVVTQISPLGDYTITTFKDITANQQYFDTDTEFRQGSSQTLRKVHKDWVCDNIPVSASAGDISSGGGAQIDIGLGNCRTSDVTTTLYDTSSPLTKKVHYDYDASLTYNYPSVAYAPPGGTLQNTNYTTTFGNPTKILEYDWGANGTPGPLLRETDQTYLTTNSANGNIDYRQPSIYVVNRLAQRTIKDGQGNIIAQTNFQYDGSALTGTTGVPQHDYTSFPSTNRARGNLTKTSRWRNTDNTWLDTVNTFNDLGNLLSQTDARGNQVTYDYTDNYSDNTNRSTQAYVTKTTYPVANGVAHFERRSYYYNSGLQRQFIDQNTQTTTTTYDNMNRLVSTVFPDGGETDVCYSDTSGASCYNGGVPLNVVTTKKISSSVNLVTTAVTDGFGRTTQTQLNSDPEGTVYGDITYDADGRKATQSSPHRSVAAATDGVTTYQYDALGRTTQVALPDGTVPTAGNPCQANNMCTQYSGNKTTVTDQTGKQRRSISDGLGRLIEVDEPGDPFAGTVSNGSLSITGTLQSIAGTNGTPGTGSVTISGSEQSKPGTAGSGSVLITGFAQCSWDSSVCDLGTVSITVNGFTDTTFYSNGSPCCPTFIVSQLIAQSQVDNNPYVTFTAGNSAVLLTAKTSGANTNYSLSASTNYDSTDSCFDPNGNLLSPCFTQPSFTPTPSGSTLTGGADPVSDSGTCTATINGTGYSVSFSQGATTGSIATALASTISAGSLASATASGATVSITAKTSGTATNYSLAGGNCSFNSSAFSGPSFAVTPSGASLTGGTNGSPAIYDSGTVTVTVGTFTASAPYGQTSNSTAAAVATALTGTGSTGLNRPGSPVSATASGSTLTLTYNTVGTAGNISVSALGATSQSASFSQASFCPSPGCSGALTGGQNPTGPSLDHNFFVTLYKYDVFDNVICMEQHGDVAGTGCPAASTDPTVQPSIPSPNTWRVRTFTYNSLSQPITGFHPESGTICFGVWSTGHCINGYDGNGNLLARTDARGVTVNYNPTDSPIDALNRVTKKTYSDTTPFVTYSYDVSCCGVTSLNPVGRMTAAFSGNTELVFSYDAMGRIKTQWDCPPSGIARGSCYVITAQYDLAGEMTSLTYPDTRTVTTNYSTAGRMTAVNLYSFNNVAQTYTYYSVPQSTASSSWGYWPSGGMNRGTFGNGIVETTAFNNRLQIGSITDVKGTQTLLSKSYGFYDASNHNNGNILSITDALSSSNNQTYSYDLLNRIATGVQTDNTFNISYSYDAWGNMRESGTSNFNQTFDTSNRIQGWSYDASGNLLNDTFHAYTYDGEGRMKTVDGTGATYTYNPSSNRVRKDVGSVSTEYFFFGGNIIAELNPSTGAWVDYIFGYGKRIAQDSSSNGSGTKYFQADQIDSTRIITDNTGVVVWTAVYTPYGQELNPQNSAIEFQFAGMEYDGETALDHTQFRQYAGTEGRWLSPDPYGGSLQLGNPQSLNRYVYVLNNPLNLTDPLGLVPSENDNVIDQGDGAKCPVDGIDYPCGFIMLSRSRNCLIGCTVGGYEIEPQQEQEQEQEATNNNNNNAAQGGNNAQQGPANPAGSTPCTCQLMARPFQRLWIFGWIVPHSLWDVIDENGNEHIVSGQSDKDNPEKIRYLVVREYTPDKSKPLKDKQNQDFLGEKRGAHPVGAPIHSCEKANTLLQAKNQFPTGIHYKLLSMNSNRAAHWLGILIGVMTTGSPGPHRALGFSNGQVY